MRNSNASVGLLIPASFMRSVFSVYESLDKALPFIYAAAIKWSVGICSTGKD